MHEETSRASLSMMIPRDQTVSSWYTTALLPSAGRERLELYTVGRIPISYDVSRAASRASPGEVPHNGRARGEAARPRSGGRRHPALAGQDGQVQGDQRVLQAGDRVSPAAADLRAHQLRG